MSMRNGHTQFFAAGDFAGDGIWITGNSDQIGRGALFGEDHRSDALLRADDSEPFGLDVIRGTQDLQLLRMIDAILVVLGKNLVVLGLGLLFGQAIWSCRVKITIVERDFEGVLQVTNFRRHALQGRRVIAHGGAAHGRVKDFLETAINACRI
ncbi:hypothetical protein ACCQ13_08070 [Xanthomonas sp. NCPPB 1638]|uniref:hypothetical protein n=1 Tax=Xanthomonas sp. NCPPB 1638 TaxID=487535 RepID=UPI001CB79414|nr:hypothetical protein [Xanthomonas cucurbitae]